MEDTSRNCFVVYVRDETKSLHRPETVERAVATCSDANEIAQIRQRYRRSGVRCIVRSICETGGSD